MRDERSALSNLNAPESRKQVTDADVSAALAALKQVLSDDDSSQRIASSLWHAKDWHGSLLVSLDKHGFFSPKLGVTWVLAEAGRTNSKIYWRVADKDIFVMKRAFSKFDQIEDRFGVGKLEDKLRASTLRFLQLWKKSGENKRPTALMVAKFSLLERLDPTPNKPDSPLIRVSAEIPEEILAAAKPIVDISEEQLLRAVKSRTGANSAALLLLNGIEEDSSWEGFEDIPDEWAALLFGDEDDG